MGKLSPGVIGDSTLVTRVGWKWEVEMTNLYLCLAIGHRDTALSDIRGQLDPNLFRGGNYHPNYQLPPSLLSLFPSLWQRTVMPAGR